MSTLVDLSIHLTNKSLRYSNYISLNKGSVQLF
jgi:hypothetical protein